MAEFLRVGVFWETLERELPPDPLDMLLLERELPLDPRESPEREWVELGLSPHVMLSPCRLRSSVPTRAMKPRVSVCVKGLKYQIWCRAIIKDMIKR
jgi:hypothetical protein